MTTTRFLTASALALLVGCGAKTPTSNPSSGLGDDGGAGASASGADGGAAFPVRAACGDYFAALYLRCNGPTLPSGELTRVRDRFLAECSNQLALPNTGTTVAKLEACATALRGASCQLGPRYVPACDFRGSLSGGAVCTDDLQCQSGTCGGGLDRGNVTGCGTCTDVMTDGGNCETLDTVTACPGGQACLVVNDSDIQNLVTACTPIAFASAGEPCTGNGVRCQAGLACTQQGLCAPLGKPGDPCNDGADTFGVGTCAPPAACNTLEGTCQAAPAGNPCASDVECAPGLACALAPCPPAPEVCIPAGACAAVTWHGPSESCDAYVARCLVGACNLEGDAGTGTCPAVLPDGAFCNPNNPGATCDTFSDCIADTCTPHGAAKCP